MTRWLAKNRETLTAEQIDSADAAIASITADVYRFGEPDVQRQTQITEIVNRLKVVMTPEQFRDFAVAGAKHVPA